MSEQLRIQSTIESLSQAQQTRLMDQYTAGMLLAHFGDDQNERIAGLNLVSNLATCFIDLPKTFTQIENLPGVHPSPLVNLTTREVIELAQKRGVTRDTAAIFISAFHTAHHLNQGFLSSEWFLTQEWTSQEPVTVGRRGFDDKRQ